MRHHEPHALGGREAADHGPLRALQNLDDRALLAAARINAADAGQRPVAVQHLAHLAGGEKQVLAALLRNQEAEAVGMAADAPAHQVHLARQAVEVAAVAQNLAVALHGAQAPPEGVLVARPADRERIRHLAERQRRGALGEQRQHRLAAGHGEFVFLRLPFGRRVG